MTTAELRQKAYSALVSRGVRYPMPDQVVAEMHRQRVTLGSAGNVMDQLDEIFGIFRGAK